MRATRADMEKVIIPVAGGKGGVGKSLLTANLAMALADLGHETIAVDLDLGGSNLHSFLGLSNEYRGVGDFLLDRCEELSALVVPTGRRRLGFLAGDGRNPFMANISHAHKVRLMRALHRLPARYILLDLGAGSSYNTLDFFALSPRGLVVSTPELPAVMNMMTFLKNLMLRRVAREINTRQPLRHVVDTLRSEPMQEKARTISDLLEQIEAVDADSASHVRRMCSSVCPRLVLNMVEHPEELNLLRHVEESLQKRLSLAVDFFGCLYRDPAVRRSTGVGRPLLAEQPEGVYARGVTQLAERLVRLWEEPIADSREKLLRSSARSYQQWVSASA